MASKTELDIIVSAKDQASSALKGVGDTLKGIGVAAAAAGAAAAAAIGAFAVSSLRDFSEVGDAVEKMASRTGVSAEAISGLRVAADQSGTSIDALEGALKKMAVGMETIGAEGTVMAEVMHENNIEWDALVQLSPEKMFETLGNAIGGIEDPIMKTKAAVEVFGKSGTDLIPMFEGGTFSMEQWVNEAEKLGVKFDDLSAAKAAALNDAIGKMDTAWSGLKLRIAGELAPAVTGFIEDQLIPLSERLIGSLPSIEQIRTAFGNLRQSVVDAIAKFDESTGIVTQLRDGFERVWATIQTELVPAFRGLWEAMQPLIPFFEALAKVVGAVLVVALKILIEALVFIAETSARIIATFTKFVTLVLQVLKPAIGVLTSALNSIGSAIDYVISKFEAMKAAALSALSAARSAAASIPGVGPIVNAVIPKFADGGIVTRPTVALVGEAGPEAIIPLSDMRSASAAGAVTVRVFEGATVTITGEGDEDRLVKKITREIASVFQSQRSGLATHY